VEAEKRFFPCVFFEPFSVMTRKLYPFAAALLLGLKILIGCAIKDIFAKCPVLSDFSAGII
jgi:hypothetical protein